MEIRIERYKSDKDTTLGKLYINDIFECYTLEDELRRDKIMHETRIPSGKYQVDFQTNGTMTKKYAVKFPAIHKGMLEIKNVPNFTTIYIHVGNNDDDTSGCILVGRKVDERNMRLIDSTSAYVPLYIKISQALQSNEPVNIKILDVDLA